MAELYSIDLDAVAMDYLARLAAARGDHAARQESVGVVQGMDYPLLRFWPLPRQGTEMVPTGQGLEPQPRQGERGLPLHARAEHRELTQDAASAGRAGLVALFSALGPSAAGLVARGAGAAGTTLARHPISTDPTLHALLAGGGATLAAQRSWSAERDAQSNTRAAVRHVAELIAALMSTRWIGGLNEEEARGRRALPPIHDDLHQRAIEYGQAGF